MQIQLYAVIHGGDTLGEIALPGNRVDTDPVALKMALEFDHREELGSPSIICQSSEYPSQIPGYQSARKYWADLTDKELASYWVSHRKNPYKDSAISFGDYVIQSAIESHFETIHNN